MEYPVACISGGFNTQPPEGGWLNDALSARFNEAFQHTAARRRLANKRIDNLRVSGRFNTQPPEGGWCRPVSTDSGDTSFNTQPPEGGWIRRKKNKKLDICFNTQPPEGGWEDKDAVIYPPYWFQHTAARRRLGKGRYNRPTTNCFNTQPPEGGWHV